MMMVTSIERRQFVANGVISERSQIASAQKADLNELGQTAIDGDQIDAARGLSFLMELFGGERTVDPDRRPQERLSLTRDLQTATPESLDPLDQGPARLLSEPLSRFSLGF